MAKKQTRRTVSLNGSDYEVAKQEAARRGVTLAALVEAGLVAIGVPVGDHPRQTAERAQMNAALRAASVAGRRPSRERQMLGDEIANACGFA